MAPPFAVLAREHLMNNIAVFLRGGDAKWTVAPTRGQQAWFMHG